MPSDFSLDSPLNSTSSQSFKTISLKNRAAGAKEELTFRYIVKGTDESIKYGKRSPFIVFNNKLDTSAPNPITNLTGKPSLGSFIFSWTASTSKDVKTHEITISDSTGTKTQTRVFTSEPTSYTLTNAEVLSIFGGTFVSTIRFSVKVVDNSGNKSSAVYIDVSLADDSDVNGLLIAPSAPVLTAGVESVEIFWDGKNSATPSVYYSPNIEAVDVYINSVKVHTFTPVYTGQIPAGFAGHKTSVRYNGGTIVTAYLIARDKFSRSRSSAASNQVVVLQQPAAQIEDPTLPSGLSATSTSFGVLVSWDGTYTSNDTFAGFKAIKIYADTNNWGSYYEGAAADSRFAGRLVGTMSVDSSANKITVGLEALRQTNSLSGDAVYTTGLYYYYIAENQSGVLYKVGNLNRYTRINSSPITPAKANLIDLANGLISIENLVAGNGRFTSYLRTGSDENAARIELSSQTSSVTPSGASKAILPGLSVYPSGSTSNPVFRADLSGNVSIDLGSTNSTPSFKVGSGTNTFYIQAADTPGQSGTKGIWAGASTITDAPFSVTFSGQLKASQAIISGTLNASSGGFGTLKPDNTVNNGWIINGARIQSVVNGITNSDLYLDGQTGLIKGALFERSGTTGTITINDSGFKATSTVNFGGLFNITNTATIGYDGKILIYTPSGDTLLSFSDAHLKVKTDLLETELWPGSIYLRSNASTSYSTGASAFVISSVLNSLEYQATGYNNITWKNYYVNTAQTAFITSRVWGPTGADISTGLGQYNYFRPMGLLQFGTQVLGPKFFSGSAATASAVATETSGTAGGTLNGDFYFSTA